MTLNRSRVPRKRNSSTTGHRILPPPPLNRFKYISRRLWRRISEFYTIVLSSFIVKNIYESSSVLFNILITSIDVLTIESDFLNRSLWLINSRIKYISVRISHEYPTEEKNYNKFENCGQNVINMRFIQLYNFQWSSSNLDGPRKFVQIRGTRSRGRSSKFIRSAVCKEVGNKLCVCPASHVAVLRVCLINNESPVLDTLLNPSPE